MNLKVDKSVKNFLLDFGLTDKEITVYTTLLKTGPNTIMNLARETNIKRSTTHNTVEELIKKGLVSQTNYGERRMVIAEDPDKLKFLMEQKKWDINKLEKNLPDAINSIYTMVPTVKGESDLGVKYYEGEAGVKLIYSEALKSRELRSYVNFEAVLEVLPDNGELFLEAQRKNKDLILKEIVVDSPIARQFAAQFAKHENYHYKFAPSSLDITALDILLFDNKVAILSVGKDRKLSGMIISNEDYSHNMAGVFDFIWEVIH